MGHEGIFLKRKEGKEQWSGLFHATEYIYENNINNWIDYHYLFMHETKINYTFVLHTDSFSQVRWVNIAVYGTIIQSL